MEHVHQHPMMKTNYTALMQSGILDFKVGLNIEKQVKVQFTFDQSWLTGDCETYQDICMCSETLQNTIAMFSCHHSYVCVIYSKHFIINLKHPGPKEEYPNHELCKGVPKPVIKFADEGTGVLEI